MKFNFYKGNSARIPVFSLLCFVLFWMFGPHPFVLGDHSRSCFRDHTLNQKLSKASYHHFLFERHPSETWAIGLWIGRMLCKQQTWVQSTTTHKCPLQAARKDSWSPPPNAAQNQKQNNKERLEALVQESDPSFKGMICMHILLSVVVQGLGDWGLELETC